MKYYMTQTTNTSADALLALGFAVLLQRCGQSGAIMIRDRGFCYEVECGEEMDLAQIPHTELLVPFVGKQHQGQRTGFDYEAAWGQKPFPPLLGNYHALVDFLSTDTYNALAARWVTLSLEQQQAHISLLCDLFSTPLNDVDAAEAAWTRSAKEQGLAGKPYVTLLQVVNPTTGKGANASKAGKLSVGQQTGFWLLELLKMVGFMAGALCFVDSVGNRKVVVPVPSQITLASYLALMESLRGVRPVTPVRLDLLLLLDTAVFLAAHPECACAWLEINSYQNMGKAFAMMNSTRLGVPVVRDEAILQTMRRVALGLVSARDEEGGEEGPLLQQLRDGLCGDTARFTAFAAAYGPYVLARREQGARISQLDIQSLAAFG